MRKKIVAIIPIKLNNERLPGKNTKLLNNKPLINYIQESLVKVSQIDEIYVYCSDEKIKDYLIDGVKFLKRDKILDESTSNFTQIFSSFMNQIDSDIYVYTHATAPFIKTASIEECIDKVVEENFDSAFTAESIQDYIWYDEKAVNFDSCNLPRSQDLVPVYRETSGVYIFEKNVFEINKTRIGNKPYIKEVDEIEAIDINYPSDFQKAEEVVSVYNNFSNVDILDCTLRDGGNVNAFKFSDLEINNIRKFLMDSNIKDIELGYMVNSTENANTSDTTLYSSFEQIEKYIPENTDCNFLAMIDYGKFDISSIVPSKLTSIRLAFHKKDRFSIVEYANKILDCGYKLYIQPMLTLTYSREEIVEFIEFVNNKLSNATAVYVVDTFGQMEPSDISSYTKLFDSNLNKKIKLGLHLHNNKELAYANAIEFMNVNINRDKILDASIFGMGKGAGNLKLEMMLEKLNDNYNVDFQKLIMYLENFSTEYYKSNNWGYSILNIISSRYGITTSYLNYFNSKKFDLSTIISLIKDIPEAKKFYFDKNTADEILLKRGL